MELLIIVGVIALLARGKKETKRKGTVYDPATGRALQLFEQNPLKTKFKDLTRDSGITNAPTI